MAAHGLVGRGAGQKWAGAGSVEEPKVLIGPTLCCPPPTASRLPFRPLPTGCDHFNQLKFRTPFDFGRADL